MEVARGDAVYLTGILLTLMAFLTSVSSGLECYACVYIPGASNSMSSCSDPWWKYRDDLNFLTGPFNKRCDEGACMKIVIKNVNDYDTVVRTCGRPCNASVDWLEVKQCCTTDLCNHGVTWRQPALLHYIAAVMTAWILSR